MGHYFVLKDLVDKYEHIPIFANLAHYRLEMELLFPGTTFYTRPMKVELIMAKRLWRIKQRCSLQRKIALQQEIRKEKACKLEDARWEVEKEGLVEGDENWKKAGLGVRHRVDPALAAELEERRRATGLDDEVVEAENPQGDHFLEGYWCATRRYL